MGRLLKQIDDQEGESSDLSDLFFIPQDLSTRTRLEEDEEVEELTEEDRRGVAQTFSELPCLD